MRHPFRVPDRRPNAPSPTGRRPCAGCGKPVDLDDRRSSWSKDGDKFYHATCEPEQTGEDWDQ